jgi:DNA-binding response OmpR family regulator/signal transduction histidine kinase
VLALSPETSPDERERSAALDAWQALLAALPNGAVIGDAHRQIVVLNRAAEDLLSVEIAHVKGCPLTDLVDPLTRALGLSDSAARELHALLAGTDSPTDQIAERTFAAADKAHYLSLRMVPLVLAPTSSPAAYHVLLLTPAHSGAETPAQPLDELTHALAHGLAESLAAIHKALPSLEPTTRGADPATQRHTLHQIGERTDEMLAALAALDGLISLRDGAAALQTAPVELSDLLMRIAGNSKHDTSGHTFELALKGEEPRIIADEQWVERAITLLLEHAIKMAPRGGTIHLGLRARHEELVVSVRQEARAVPAAQVSRLCEPFARLDGCEDVVVGGGLGLPLARAVAEAHGGRLWAEFADGMPGMTILIALPLVPPRRMPGERDTGISAPAALSLPAREPLSIERARQVVLVAHADPHLARYLRANLEEQHFRALVTGELGDLLRQIELEEPDLLLVESDLPGLGGADALHRLRAQARVPVIALARRHDARECVRALNQGASDYIAQPFNTEELVARVRAALRTTPLSSRQEAPEPLFQSGDLTIDYAQRAVAVAGQQVSLSKTEFKLLRALAHHAGMVLSHEVLLERVWGPAYHHEVEFVWVYIRRLRRKIEPDPAHPRFILTVPGVGYRLIRE